MPTKVYRGDAALIAQVDTLVAGGTWANNDTATLTMNSKTIVITFGNGIPTTAQVAAAIKAAWAGDSVTAYGETRTNTGDNIPEFAEITATVSASTVTLTHNEKGVPFTASFSETSAAGTLTHNASVTAAAGEGNFNDADNWDTNGVPADNDALVFQFTDRNLTYNLSNSGIGPTSIEFWQSYIGLVGLPRDNANDYYEYRPTYLILGDAAIATTIKVGEGEGTGSQRIKLDMGAAQSTITVFNTGTPIDNGIEAFVFKGTHASNVLNVRRGSVGVAIFSGETAVIATLNVGYVDNQQSDAQVRLGSGVTLATLNQTGGNVELNAGLTTVMVTGGTLTANAGNITTATIKEGTFNYSGTGTIGTLHVQEGATLDLTKGQGTCAITTFNLYAGATVVSPKGRFGSAPTLRLNGCTLDEVTINLGDDFNIVFV